jgi:ribonuclease P protein component
MVASASRPEAIANRRTMHRLTRRADFLAAARGARASSPVFDVQARDRRDGAEPRVGFTVTNRIGSAVVRNRIRRRLRAAARDVVPAKGHKGFDYVLIARRPALAAPYPQLIAELERAVERVHRPRRLPADKRLSDGAAHG